MFRSHCWWNSGKWYFPRIGLCGNCCTWHCGYGCTLYNGPLTRYIQLRVVHAPGMPGTFSQPPRVSDPDMHHGTCVTHVPWCMPGSLTGGFLWNRWRGKRSRHSGACATHIFTYLVRGPCRWSVGVLQSPLMLLVNFWKLICQGRLQGNIPR